MTCCARKCSELHLSKGQVWEGAHHGFFSMEGVNCICDDIFAQLIHGDVGLVVHGHDALLVHGHVEHASLEHGPVGQV